MKPIRFTLLCLLLAAAFALPGGADLPADPPGGRAELTETEDFGTEYLDRMIFLGESTTAHLRSRSQLRPEQIWANASGTMKLDSALLSRPIQEPLSGRSLTIPEAAAERRPAYLVLSFGLNGITGFVRDKEGYLDSYRTLIERIRQASPDTRIIVQSVYPVAPAECQTDWKFSVPPEAINSYVQTLNGWLPELCAGLPEVRFADTASVLRDGQGYLRPACTTDGIHLTRGAYNEILLYLRTHGWTE